LPATIQTKSKQESRVPHLANIDGIIWLVIIVVSIIAQVVKASRKAAANASATESPRSAATERRETRPAAQRTAPQKQTNHDRNDELRQFFDMLGVPVQEFAAAPQPRKRPKHKPAPVPPPTPIPVAPRKVHPRRDTESVRLETLETGAPSQTVELRELLRKAKSQHQAILLREILGPPLAMR